MAEVFTSWTEVDPNLKLIQSSSRATWTNMIEDEDCRLYKAKTTFAEFTHQFAFRLTAIDLNTYGTPDSLGYPLAVLWQVCENQGRPLYVDVGKCIHLELFEWGTSTTVFRLYLSHKDDSVQDSSNVNLDVGTTYYVTIQKSGAVVTCTIFSDAARTVTVDTLTMDLTGEDEEDMAFSYIQTTASGNIYSVNDQSDGYVENLNPYGDYGDFLANSGGSVKDMHIIDWDEEQSWDVAIRDVPLRTAGSKVDTGHKVINPKIITIVIRLSTANKTTLQALIDANEITIFATADGVWSYEVWIATRRPVWNYKKVMGTDDVATVKPWQTTIKLVVQNGGKV